MSEKPNSTEASKPRFPVFQIHDLITSLLHPSGQIKRIDREPSNSISFIAIDENEADNPFVHNSAIPIPVGEVPKDWFALPGLTETTEGFHHNSGAHRDVGRKLTKLFNLGAHSKVMEFGCGANYQIAQGLQENGVDDITLLDYSAHSPTQDKSLIKIPTDVSSIVLNSVPLLAGDVTHALDKRSALSAFYRSFDFIMANGAMFSFGYNLTVAFAGQAEYHSLPEAAPDKNKNRELYTREYISRAIYNVSELLNSGGVFFFSSSRYADHGSGYPDLMLHHEKLEFLKLIDELISLGAKKITVFGVSSGVIERNIAHNLGPPGSKSRTSSVVKRLFIDSINPPFQLVVHEAVGERRLRIAELAELLDGPHGVEQLLAIPQVNEAITAELSELERKLDELQRFLSAPVDELIAGLSNPNESFVFRNLSQLQSGFPNTIARIDAVAAEF